MDRFSFLTKQVEISEVQGNGNLTAKFCLCDFSVNANGVQLNRDTVEDWMGSLVNQPLVGRVGYSGDFTGHNMRTGTVTGADGVKRKEVMFDTEAFGTFTDVSIETVNDVDCIVGTVEIWGRYPLVCELIKKRVAEGTLHTSWEIITSESHNDGNVKVIDNGSFIGLCMLGKNVPPAYESSGLLEVAESFEDDEFSEALSTDISNDLDKEVTHMDEKEKLLSQEEVEISGAPVVSEPESSESKPSAVPEDKKDEDTPAPEEDNEDKDDVEVSSLTVRDIRFGLEDAIRGTGLAGYVDFVFPEDHTCLFKAYENQKALTYIQYSYSVEGDTVSVSDPVIVELVATPVQMNQMIAEKTNALAEAGAKITELETQIAELAPYREAAEKAAAEKLVAEKQAKENALKEYAMKSGFITEQECSEDESVKSMIAELNENGIKQLIADRLIASLADKTEKVVETSSAEVEEVATMNLYDGKSDNVECDLVSAYINS